MSADGVGIGILGFGGFAMFAAQQFAQVPGAALRSIAGTHREASLACAARFGLADVQAPSSPRRRAHEPRAKTVYEEFHRRMSFPSPPNFIMTQGHSLAMARGTWEVVRNVLVCGDIPQWTKEMMFVAISKDRTCRIIADATAMDPD